jgi:hypothetical protein
MKWMEFKKEVIKPSSTDFLFRDKILLRMGHESERNL